MRGRCFSTGILAYIAAVLGVACIYILWTREWTTEDLTYSQDIITPPTGQGHTTRKCVDDLLDAHIHRIVQIRIDLLESDVKPSSGQRCSRKGKPVAAWYDDFLSILENYKDIRTVFMNGSPTCALQSGYYMPGSNNCAALEMGQKGPSRGKRCEQVRVMAESRTLPQSELDIGIPMHSKWNKSANDAMLTYIHIIPDAEVYPYGDVFYGDIRIIPNRCLRGESPRCRVSFSRRFLQHSAVYDEVFTITQAWGQGVFHSIAENIIRTSPYIDFLRQNPHIKIHVATKHKLLEVLGFQKDRLITGRLRAKILYMPAGIPCGQVQPLPVQLLATSLQAGLKQAHLQRNLVVLIKRSKKRFFDNHDQILKMLETHAGPMGLSVEVFRDDPVPSLRRTMEMFHRAVAIVAPHGAGETNMVFSQPGTLVIEGLCQQNNRFNLCYRDMAYRLGLRYYGLAFSKDCRSITAEDIGTPFLEFVNGVH